MSSPDELGQLLKDAPGRVMLTLPNFTRLECQQIADRARTIADAPGLNAEWAVVYRQLQMAASTLDAFLARMELPLVIEKYAPAGDKTGVPQNPGVTSQFDWEDTGMWTGDEIT